MQNMLKNILFIIVVFNRSLLYTVFSFHTPPCAQGSMPKHGLYALLFEVLIVLESAPGTTPTETVLKEKAIAEVVGGNLVFKRLRTVNIGLTRCWFNLQRAVFLPAHAGIVERIDVDGKALGVLGEFRAAGNWAIAVTRRVVGLHGTLVVVGIVGNRANALDGVLCFVELGKDVAQVGSYLTVADDDALLGPSLEVDVLYL